MRGAIHDIVVRIPTGAAVSPEGVATATFAAHPVRGQAATLGAREQEFAAQRGLIAHIAVQLPPETLIDASAEVDVAGTGRLGLDGRYRVVEVRPNRQAQRVLCARYELPELARTAS